MSFLSRYDGLTAEGLEAFFDQAETYRPILAGLRIWLIRQPQTSLRALERRPVREAIADSTKYDGEDIFQIYRTLAKIFVDPEVTDHIIESPKESIEKLDGALKILERLYRIDCDTLDPDKKLALIKNEVRASSDFSTSR